MARPIVTANSRQVETRKIEQYDPSTASPDTSRPDYNDCSFLYGACHTNDMGRESGPFSNPANGDYGTWEERYARTRRLRRHTVEQGMSTFSFPKDRVRE